MFDTTQCPKWNKCNAPACPIDPDWHKRALMNDDPVCFYMQEAVKNGAATRFQVAGLGELHALIQSMTPAMAFRWSRVRKALDRAKLSGSRMDNVAPNLKGGAE